MKQEIEKMKSRLLLLAFILMVPIGVFAQNITVKGNVTDSEGEPIIGCHCYGKRQKPEWCHH